MLLQERRSPFAVVFFDSRFRLWVDFDSESNQSQETEWSGSEWSEAERCARVCSAVAWRPAAGSGRALTSDHGAAALLRSLTDRPLLTRRCTRPLTHCQLPLSTSHRSACAHAAHHRSAMSAATAASPASGSAPLVSPCGPPSACPIGADSLSFLSAYARSQRFATGQPSGFAVASQGERVYFLRTEGEGAVTQNLYEVSQTVGQAEQQSAVAATGGATDREGTSALLLVCDLACCSEAQTGTAPSAVCHFAAGADTDSLCCSD